MTTLTVTAKGQVTLRKNVLQHLGIGPGDKVEVDLDPGGKVVLKAERPTGSIEDVFGMLNHLARDRAPTIEELNDIIADGWANRRR